MRFINVKGARVHNLKNVHLQIPRDRLVVITGLSGSGKSSLAFDTIYAEGQRRYVESLSAYARQFLEVMEKPDVDSIEGLSPAISIEQKSASHNPRSTVGTVTEIHDYLRLLFARIGEPHCPRHGIKLEASSADQIVDALLRLPRGRKMMILSPLVIDRRGEYSELFRDLAGRGFARVRVDGKIYDTEDAPALAKTVKHTIEIVIDRLAVGSDARERLAESVETAVAHAAGRVHAIEMESEFCHVFSTAHACPKCGWSPPEIEPKLFSFNNPKSACPNCGGLGAETLFDPSRVVENPELPLAGGAIRGWDRRNPYSFALLKSLAAHYDFDLGAPFEKLPPRIKRTILYGSGTEEISLSFPGEGGGIHKKRAPFEGIIPSIERRFGETDSPYVREELARYQVNRTCAVCKGARLSESSLAVKIGGRAIHELSALALGELPEFFDSLSLSETHRRIGERVIKEIRERLGFLIDVGLDYLTLGRSAATLAGGEAQRIRLASQIGTKLTGVTYVLDEPSIGLHPADNQRLLETLMRLRDLNNTVIVVEHDEAAIRAADYIVDMGVGAGAHGGEIVAHGKIKSILKTPRSLTAQYLTGRRTIAVPAQRRRPKSNRALAVKGARGNNLKNITAKFPLGLFVCVTGVSGSGKSTLVRDILWRATTRHLHGGGEEPLAHDSISGLENLDKIVHVDQSPIGRTPRSNPATYTGLFTPIRELFSGVPLARERGYAPGRFSFNVPGGRCESCQGDGVVRVEMHFLPDVFVTCEACSSKRYGRETLEIRYKGKNIHEVLTMTVEEARGFFANVPTAARRLQTLADVGLGYIRLGQSATTISGGEAQRVKLSLELSKRETGGTLYILDEPTTGLHFHDINLLLSVLHRLADAGNTVIVIEHNLDVVKTADWVIDLGPKGGAKGGRIVAVGTPEDLIENKSSLTGIHLRPILHAAKKPAKKKPAKKKRGIIKNAE